MSLPPPRPRQNLPKPYYQDEWVTIYHGDNKNLIPSLGKFDLLLTDPPYIIAVGGGGLSKKRQDFKKISGKIDEGFDMSLLERFENWICFCGKQQLRGLIDTADDSDGSWMLITFFKKSVSPMVKNTYLPDVEFAVHKWSSGRLFGECRDKSRIAHFPNERGEFSHPTVKPLSIISKLIKLGSKEGDSVFDPFMGTGSTLVACKALKRKCIGIEKELQWCEVAKQRVQQEILL